MNKNNLKSVGKEAESKLPADFRKALATNVKAKAQWGSLTPIARRDFISWIDSAKQAETRKRRVDVACLKLVAGKRRPCCYSIVPMNLYTALNADSKAKAEWGGLSPAERRDLIGWIEGATPSETRDSRIEKVCAMLASGKRYFTSSV